MRPLKIAQRLAPFVTMPGVSTPLPQTSLVFTLYPNHFLVHDLATGRFFGRWECLIPEPIEKFRLENNLEKGFLEVRLESDHSFFLYQIHPAGAQGFQIVTKRSKGAFSFPGACSFQVDPQFVPILSPRITLGVSKRQEWNAVWQRGDLLEVLPFWHLLGRQAPLSFEEEGSETLCGVIEASVTAKKRALIFPLLKKLFLTAFRGILHPQTQDEWGWGSNQQITQCSPLAFLRQGAHMIESLFFQEVGEELSLLPCLPGPCHSGRILGLPLQRGAILSFEWRAGQLRHALLVNPTQEEQQFSLRWPKGTSYRVSDRNCSLKTALVLPPQTTLRLDRFS